METVSVWLPQSPLHRLALFVCATQNSWWHLLCEDYSLARSLAQHNSDGFKDMELALSQPRHLTHKLCLLSTPPRAPIVVNQWPYHSFFLLFTNKWWTKWEKKDRMERRRIEDPEHVGFWLLESLWTMQVLDHHFQNTDRVRQTFHYCTSYNMLVEWKWM